MGYVKYTGTLLKYQVAQKLDISMSTLRRLLNEKYYEDLKEFNKNMVIEQIGLKD